MAEILLGNTTNLATSVSDTYIGDINGQAVRVIDNFIGDSTGHARNVPVIHEFTLNIQLKKYCYFYAQKDKSLGSSTVYQTPTFTMTILNPEVMPNNFSLDITCFMSVRSIKLSGSPFPDVSHPTVTIVNNVVKSLTKDTPTTTYTRANVVYAGMHESEYAKIIDCYFKINNTIYARTQNLETSSASNDGDKKTKTMNTTNEYSIFFSV